MTMNTNQRKGAYIPRDIYRDIREFILKTLQNGPVTLSQLLERAKEEMSADTDDNISWYLLRVKHDLEARKIIKVKVGLGPERIQVISLAKGLTIL